MATKKKLLEAAAGNAGGGALNVEDVFSTYLYDGTGSTQTITNGIDLDGEGGLVWLKDRDRVISNRLIDTERGATKNLISSSTGAEFTQSTVTSFNSNGFSLGNESATNSATYNYASWTFRKAPKFFDVVTYTGDGQTLRDLSHSLGGDIGTIMVKRTDSSSDWYVLSRNSDASNGVRFTKLNSTAAGAYDGSNHSVYWTDTTFRPALVDPAGTNTNISGGTYVAYLFAHNDGDGEFGSTADQDIIKCGSYTGSGSTGHHVDLGFEPQWILVKESSASGDNWILMDSMRGLPGGTGTSYNLLFPNLSNAEASGTASDLYTYIDATGFGYNGSSNGLNQSGETYIYVAIRRGPMAVPESATDVFAIDTFGGTAPTPPAFISGFPVDFAIRYSTGTDSNYTQSRLTGETFLQTNSTSAEVSSSPRKFDYMDGYYDSTGTNTGLVSPMWKRAPNYFDVVAYTGNSVSGRTINHNLGVAPEMMWVKTRSNTYNWMVYHTATGNTKALTLESSGTGYTGSSWWNNTSPSSTVFTVGNDGGTNYSGRTYIAYLFASLDGVSKVFSVTKSSGSDASVNCGFSAGPRFVLLKRTDSTGDWYVWDSERGIVAGNDPYLLLNSTAAEVTSTDYIDPTSNGFTIVNGGLADGDYIGYAVA